MPGFVIAHSFPFTGLFYLKANSVATLDLRMPDCGYVTRLILIDEKVNWDIESFGKMQFTHDNDYNTILSILAYLYSRATD